MYCSREYQPTTWWIHVFPGHSYNTQKDGSLKTSVYRKPTHADLYLQWDSHHTISSKYSVVGTLYHRAKTICSSTQLLQKEEQHFFQALKRYKYPTWALNRVKMRSQNPTKNQNRSNNNNAGQNSNNKKNAYMVVPYYQGLSESIKRSCKNMGYKCTSKEDLPSKTSLWLQRIKTISWKKWSHIQI